MPHNNKPARAQALPSPARRLAIKQMATAFGLTLSASALDSLALSTTPSTASAKPFFSTEQLQLVGAIAELIIPATDTPGALAAGVHTFLDHFVPECCSKAEQAQLLNGLTQINTLSQQLFKCQFLLANSNQQTQLLTLFDTAQAPCKKTDYEFFRAFKSLTLFGYYTSEIGATKELAYLAVPGGYKGNVPFNTVGKAWALN